VKLHRLLVDSALLDIKVLARGEKPRVSEITGLICAVKKEGKRSDAGGMKSCRSSAGPKLNN
jgi:hypothetical protein